MRFARNSALACLLVLSATAAYADDCSGRDHTTGTVLGAAGGAAIGGVATHNAGGAVAGAVVGGLAGNAIARSQDCDRSNYDRGSNEGYDRRGGEAYDRRGDRGPTISYYGRGYDVSPDENDYWGVKSYDDFSADYRHIWDSINRARERGSLNPYEARRFSQRLQQIQYRANAQQRRGRFDAQDIEYQLGQLRDDMRTARRNNRDEQNSGNYDHR